jgi:hypothetical protein
MGQADLMTGELAGAERAFAAGLAAAHNMPIFASINASGMAIALARRGKLDDARSHAQRALAEATPQTVFEARVAAAEVAVAARDPNAERIIRDATLAAQRSGHLISLPRLGELAARS